jgi:hypothetical protein
MVPGMEQTGEPKGIDEEEEDIKQEQSLITNEYIITDNVSFKFCINSRARLALLYILNECFWRQVR